MSILLKSDYAKFGVSNFFQKLSKQNLWGAIDPPPLVKEGLNLRPKGFRPRETMWFQLGKIKEAQLKNQLTQTDGALVPCPLHIYCDKIYFSTEFWLEWLLLLFKLLKNNDIRAFGL